MAAPAIEDLEAHWLDWWRAADDELAAEHGFLAATGLTWLTTSPVRIEGIPGRWGVDEGVAYVALADREELVIEGRTVAGPASRRPVPTVAAGQPSPIRYRDVVIEVLARAEGVFVRPRNPQSPARLGFTGTPAFPYTAGWRLRGWFTPAAPDDGSAAVLALPSVMPGLTNRYRAAGTVAIEVGGRSYALQAYHHRSDGMARMVFTDPTNGVSTYRTGRYLDVDLPPTGEGPVVVDFNRARDFPCSYTDAPTCPTAPAANQLAVEVRAGARRYGESG